MKISIHGRQMVVTDAIREYAESKIGRITTYNDGVLEIAVTLSAAKLKTGNYHTAEVLVYLEGSTVKASCTEEDLYAAIDQVTDKLERQLKKHKEKIQDAIRSREPMARKMHFDPVTKTVEKEAAQVVTVYLPPKPMSLEEAILQLEVMNRQFLAYTNMETGDMNIVYRRKDGDYGHIVPKEK